MSRGYVGEIFNSIQGEGLFLGRRQVFVRFAGCSLDCIFCDTESFRRFSPAVCYVERKPSAMKFKRVANPLSHSEVVGHVRRLTTAEVRDVSLTGGEPLQAGDFLVDVARACRRIGLRTYLETNGAVSREMRRVVAHIDIASIDVKLPEHRAVPPEKWKSLLDEELSCIRLSLENGVSTFVKIVVLPSTTERTVAQVSKHLVRIGDVPLVIQPVTPARGVARAPPMARVYRLSQAAATAGIKEIAIIPQVHRQIGVF